MNYKLHYNKEKWVILELDIAFVHMGRFVYNAVVLELWNLLSPLWMCFLRLVAIWGHGGEIGKILLLLPGLILASVLTVCVAFAGFVAEQFLNNTATQLTYHGLCELTSAVQEGELCVFFRNNHFSTMTKYKVHPAFFVFIVVFCVSKQVTVFHCFKIELNSRLLCCI